MSQPCELEVSYLGHNTEEDVVNIDRNEDSEKRRLGKRELQHTLRNGKIAPFPTKRRYASTTSAGLWSDIAELAAQRVELHENTEAYYYTNA